MAKKGTDETISLLKEIVQASNRTNHAVRAIVRPIYIQLVTTLILLPLLLFYSFEPSVGALVLIALVVVAGGVAAIAALISEFSRSKIPYDFDKELLAAYEREASESFAPEDESGAALTEGSATPSAPKTFVLPGECECSTWQRGFLGTAMENGKEVCMRCLKQMPLK